MDNKNDLLSILMIIAGFVIFWPLGLFLLLKKIGVFGQQQDKRKTASAELERKLRCDKYKIMSEGKDSISIDYLASAVGISFESTVRDLQQLIQTGEFGKDAYINYVDKTLVLTARKTASAAGAKKPEKAGGRKNPLKAPLFWSLILGVCLLVIGFFGISDALDALAAGAAFKTVIWNAARSLFCLLGGGISFLGRRRLQKKAARYKKYFAALTGHGYMTVSELSEITGFPRDTVRRDLEALIEKDAFDTAAYIDVGSDMIILDPASRPAKKAEPRERKEDNEDRYKAIIREIRAINEAIPDPVTSEKIDRIEDLTSKIFNVVREKPEKLPQTKSFMSYYLPTTLKLLHSYAEFEAAGAEGENVEKAKQDIHRILDTLSDGFAKQLDRLYAADAMDISSDIEVLESMMKRDGLSEDESGFGSVMGGH